MADFSKAVELQPDDGDYYYWRGSAHYELKDFPSALADFSKAVELQPDNGDYYYWRGRAHYELKDFSSALVDFSKATELQPDDGYNYAWRGCTHLAMKNKSLAEADFTRVEQLLKNDAWPAFNVACGYAKGGYMESTITWLRRAFVIDKKLIDKADTEALLFSIHSTPQYMNLVAEFRDL
jgi:tetratricopeptide (TPR) repeat protein